MKGALLKLFFFVLVLGLSHGVSAESYKGRSEIGGFAGAIFFEGDSNINEDGIFGGRLGHNFAQHWAFELGIGAGQTEVEKTNLDADFLYGAAEVQYHLGSQKLRPFFSLGVGALDIDRERLKDETDFIIPYGIGLKWLLAQHFSARIDGRHIINVDRGVGTHDAIVTGGLSLVFGGPLNQYRPEKVIETPKKTERPVGPDDSDRDGVANQIDQCPETPGGVEVDAKGCPFDSDNDGVYDYRDECPNSAPGTVVGRDGCKPPEKVEMNLDIKFDTGKSFIKAEYENQVQAVIDFMDTYPTVNAVIEGHTDSTGSEKLNRELSKKRATSVLEYIVKMGGIDPARVKARGFGSSRPVANNNTNAGRQRNRRVVATLTAID